MDKRITYGAAVLGMLFALALVKLMYDMSAQMVRMADSVDALAKEVEQMDGRMQAMVGHVEGIRTSTDRMGRVFQQGPQQLEQLNPMRMMEGMAPSGKTR